MDFLETLVKRYYKFFDDTIPDTSVVVFMIWVLVFGTGFLNQNKEVIKASIFDSQEKIAFTQTKENIIEINWKVYSIYFFIFYRFSIVKLFFKKIWKSMHINFNIFLIYNSFRIK